MSAETLEALHRAIANHAADQDPTEIVTDWFIGYSTTHASDASSSGIGYATTYTTSESSPHAVLGTAELALANLREDLTGDGDQDEE